MATTEPKWLQQSDDIDDDNEEDPTKPCDHKPRQSVLFYENKEFLEKLQMWLYICLIVGFMFLILLSSWVNLEKGNFPFNIDFMADVAYSKNKFGTPMLALTMAFFAGLALLFGQRFLIGITQNKCYESLNEHLRVIGKIRKIKPQKPRAFA
jgi:hypothetical protein